MLTKFKFMKFFPALKNLLYDTKIKYKFKI